MAIQSQQFAIFGSVVNRSVIITDSFGEKYETQFNRNATKDSEALHWLLCFVEAGDDYTVEFKSFASMQVEAIRLNKMFDEDYLSFTKAIA